VAALVHKAEASPERPLPVCFLSDYGRVDEFVAVCHGVVMQLAPGCSILDITHDIPPRDVRAGALALLRAVQYLPESVVLAVVDPGVGTERKAIAVEVETGWFVGPDNGILSPAVQMAGGALAAVVLDNTEFHLQTPAPTFAGRDVFSPAAAALARGVPLAELGSPIDPALLVPTILGVAETRGGRVEGEVLWVDRFGNAQTNIEPDSLAALGVAPGSSLTVSVGGAPTALPWRRTFADVAPGELVALVDASGLLALCRRDGDGAHALGLSPGVAVQLAPARAQGTPVRIR